MARRLHRIFAAIFGVLLALQFLLAGVAAFATEKSGPHDYFMPHVLNGLLMVLVALVLAVIAAVSPTLRWKPSTLLFVLMVTQLALGWIGSDEPWVGGLHGLNALVIASVAYVIIHRRPAPD
jgi:hypothetical protein